MTVRPQTVVVDARGQRCPLPVIRLAAAVRDLAPGSLVRVLATDPAARSDVAAFCRMRGHDLLEVTGQEDGTDAYLVRSGGPSPAAPPAGPAGAPSPPQR